jgi:hypothetical protein
MSYYILPKINNQIVINPSKTSEELFKPYISYSLLKYITTIQCHINNNILDLDDLSFNNYNELIKYINPCEYIFSKIPGSKYSVSKLKPTSNLFYDFLEVFSALNVFDIYANSSIHSLHISNSISDTIECFEMIRENYEDKIISYNNDSFTLVDEFNFLNDNLNLNTDYSVHHTFTSTSGSNYRLLINFNDKNNKRSIIKFNNFYVGKTSLTSNQITYSDVNNFITDFYSSNNNFYYISLTSNNQNIKFSTDLLNNINYIEFTNINSSLNWMFNDNDLILDKKINYPYLSNTKINDAIIINKKKTTSIGGKSFFYFQIKTFLYKKIIYRCVK